jgi:septal ring factor EnvC (AmiA/AmiB activator)
MVKDSFSISYKNIGAVLSILTIIIIFTGLISKANALSNDVEQLQKDIQDLKEINKKLEAIQETTIRTEVQVRSLEKSIADVKEEVQTNTQEIKNLIRQK